MGLVGIDVAMKSELAAEPKAAALACMDTRSGILLGLEARPDVARDAVEIAASVAQQLCCGPEEDAGDESFVVSSDWVHAYRRVPRKRDLVVVGVARGDANVALLRAWLRQVAERVA
jgi:hypothetical protein